MGKTSNKLNYLNETKEIIKQAIIDKGVDVSDTDTFRSFADKIEAIQSGGGDLPLNLLIGSKWTQINVNESFSKIILYFEARPASAQTYFEYLYYGANGTVTTSKGKGGPRLVQSLGGLKIKLRDEYEATEYTIVREWDAYNRNYKIYLQQGNTKVYQKVDYNILELQDKTITENGKYTAPLGYDGLGTVTVNIEGKEDLTAELTAQDVALTELEEAVNNLPDAVPEANLVIGAFTSNGTYVAKDEGFDGWSEITINVQNKVQEPEGGVAVNVVGAWTINPDGSANTTNGMYYNFTTDGKVQAIVNGDVTEMGTYTIEDNKIHLTAEGEEMTWYYNEDGGIAVEENAESMMWRLVPQGTLEVKENGDYDVTPNTKVTVSVSAPELVEYTITQDTDLSGGNVEFLPKYDNIIDEDLDLSTLTLDDCGQTYGFEYSTSTNRIEPLNKKKINSFAYCKIRFTMKSDGGSLAVTLYQSSEVNYDYGFISKLDTDLNKNYDSSDVNSVYNSKGLQGNYTYTFTDIPAGEHFFTFKYKKDSSNDTSEDTCAITNIHINDIDKLEADGFSKVTLEKPTDLESDNILSGKTVFGVEGNLVIADYQSTTATPQDVLLGKKFLSEEGVIIEGTVEEFIPASEYKTNMVLNTKGKIVSENITINVTAEGARDAKETMYEMQEADYMRYLQGQINRNEIPSEAEYLEQQEYVNSAIAIIMGEEF